jgi:hypothetical protein
MEVITKHESKIHYGNWSSREMGFFVRGHEVRLLLTDTEMRAFQIGDEIEVVVTFRHAEPDRCGNCKHWACVGDDLPNLGRCAMAERHVDPMMMFDDYCCDHDRSQQPNA